MYIHIYIYIKEQSFPSTTFKHPLAPRFLNIDSRKKKRKKYRNHARLSATLLILIQHLPNGHVRGTADRRGNNKRSQGDTPSPLSTPSWIRKTLATKDRRLVSFDSSSTFELPIKSYGIHRETFSAFYSFYFSLSFFVLRALVSMERKFTEMQHARCSLKILEKLMYQGQETNNNLKEKLFIYLGKRLEIFILLIKIRCKRRREAHVCWGRGDILRREKISKVVARTFQYLQGGEGKDSLVVITRGSNLWIV